MTQATKYTEIAANLDPNNLWYTQELAYMYYNQGKLEASEKNFAILVTKEPRNVDFLYGHAELLRRLNRQAEATTSFDRMEDQLGIIPEISIQKFDLYRSLKEDEKGIAEIQKARKVYPDELSLIGVLVDYYFSKNEISQAQDMLVALVKADPSNARANLALGDLYYRQFKKPEAYSHLKAAFVGEGVDLDTKMQVMVDLYNQQGVIDPELVELANTLITTYPLSAKPYSIMGDIRLKQNDSKEALKNYQKALQFEDDQFPLWNQVLMMEYELVQFDDLYKDARACSALFPNQPNVQLLYAIACNQLNRHQEAIDAVDIGKELVVNDPMTEAEFYGQKAEAQFALKKYNEGIASYEQALKIAPNNLLIKNNFALQLATANIQLSLAEKLINDVLAGNSENPEFLSTKGLILFRKNAFDEALKLFVQCQNSNPSEASYTEYVGDVYIKLGNSVKAIENWKKAQTLGSKNKVLNKKIETKTYVEAEY
jgi:tetratricopeptide (TPR) repeat protein